MNYSRNIDTICMELSILYFKGLQVKLSLNDVLLSLMIVFVLANSQPKPDEIKPLFIWVFTAKIYWYPE